MLNELKHVETHEYIQWLVNAVDWTTAELVCFCCLSFLLLLLASLDCFSLFTWSHTALAQGLHSSHLHAHVPCVICCARYFWSLRHLHSLLLLPHLHLSDHPAVLTARHLQLPRCGGQTPLRTSAEDLGTLAENEPPTSYEPKDNITTEAYVEHTQKSSSEHRFLDDWNYDDVTIGKTLLDACRRRADHSEEEGLSSCLSSSVSHERTGRPVVCRLVSSAQETQRHTSESEQIRTLLERQREQILADCQAEIRKHEFQGDYDRKSIQKLNETIESQKEEICRDHQRDERRRQNHQLIHGQLLKQNWIYVKLMSKVSQKWKNWRSFKED